MDPRDEPQRRASVALDSLGVKEARRDLEKGEIPTPRERVAQRQPSPPPSGPQVAPAVPAFGALNFGRPGPTSNVWRAPGLQQNRPAFPAGSVSLPSVPTLGGKQVPTAPKAATSSTNPAPPSGPKADRPPEPVSVESAPPIKDEEATFREDVPATVSATPQTALPSEEKKVPSAASAGSPHLATREPPTGPRGQPPPSAPAGPAALLRSPQAQPNTIRQDTVGFSTPSGPRAQTMGVSPSIPTGPRADRGPPSGPRGPQFGSAERAPPIGPRLGQAPPPRAPNQWLRPGAQPYNRPGLVPAKRGADGDDREEPRNIRRSPAFERSSSYNDFAAKAHAAPTARSEPDEELQREHSWETALPKVAEIPAQGKEESHKDVAMTEADAPSLQDSPTKANGYMAELNDSSDDDDFELGEEYIADINTKFERETAMLRGRKLDLSQPQYRATSPLERIAFLDAILPTDLPFKMSIEDPALAAPSPTLVHRSVATGGMPLPSMERPRADLLTPKEEVNEDTSMVDASPVVRTFVRPVHLEDIPRTPSPDATCLPFLVKAPPTPVSDPEQTINADSVDCKMAIEAELVRNFEVEDIHRTGLEQEFARRYLAWKRNAMQLDREARDEEDRKELEIKRLADQGKTPEPAAAETVATIPLPTPTDGGGRRSHRFASQLDLDLAIQASLETAKEDQAKQEREAVQVQADLEKEAEIPPLLNRREIDVRLYYDTNQARRQERAIEIFDFVPPVDDFTPEEHEILVQGYKADPKAWGKIAQSLPGRTYKDCINHYYTTKWTTDYKSLKDRRKRRQRTRAVRGSARPNALMSLDVKDDDGAVPAVTETGRPRRQAAPTFGEKGTDEEANAQPAASSRKPGAGTGDGAPEKARRQKVPKEKGARRAKNQPLAARPNLSPTKQDKDLKSRSPAMEGKDVVMEGMDKWPVMGEGALVGDRNSGFGMIGRAEDGHHAVPDRVPITALTAPTERPRAHSGQQPRAGASSYWSVQEQTDFRKYVMYYGTDYQQISTLMGTKTHIMVRCYVLTLKSLN